MSNPNYYAIIPADVRYDIKLTANAKLLYGEITALCGAQGFCWAKNDYFGCLYGVENETISRWIGQLKKRGYIDVIINKIEGNTRKITLSNTLLTKKSIPIDKKINTLLTKKSIPIDKKVNSYIKNNITINNTSIITDKASDFLIKNYPSRYEQEFLMKYKSQFVSDVQFNDFLEDFNDEWDGKDLPANIFGQLKKHCRNWLKFRNAKDKSEGLKVVRPESKRIG
jgi:hypothetical protein